MALWNSTPVLALTTFVAGYLVFAITSRIVTSRHHAAEARRLGCKPPPRYPTAPPFGIGTIFQLLAADREMRMPQFLSSWFAAIQPQQSSTTTTEDSTAQQPLLLTFSVAVGITSAFFTADELLVQTALATKFDDWELGDMRRKVTAPLLGDGIFTQDGGAWRRSRALLRPAFAGLRHNDLGLEERHVQNLMACLELTPGSDEGNEAAGWTAGVDLHPLFLRLSLDGSTEFLFGESTDSQLRALRRRGRDGLLTDAGGGPQEGWAVKEEKEDEDDGPDFPEAFDTALEGLSQRIQWMELGHLVWPRGFAQACRDCHAFVDKLVQRYLVRIDDPDHHDRHTRKPTVAGAAGGPDEGTYSFLAAVAAETRDPVELRDQLLNVLLAGRDTTASLLVWIFYALARDPVRFAKLRRAVLADFGDFREDPALRISFESLKSCRYLRWVIDETSRLYPVVPLNVRVAARDTTLPRGGGPRGEDPIYVPKGATLNYMPYVMHRRKDIWGDDADEFVPERWEGLKTGWEYLPFNGGPRICLGQQFALTKAAYVTVRLVQRFDRIQNLDLGPVRHKVNATMSSGTGVRVKLHEAASS